MNDFLLLLTGQITASDFMAFLFADSKLAAELDALIPQEAKTDSHHAIWNGVNKKLLEPYDYHVRDMLYSWYGFAETESSQRDVFKIVANLYCWNYPETKCRKSPDTEFDLRLDLFGETYGGKEVEDLIASIMAETRKISQKGKRTAEIKRLIRLHFHTENGVRPRWIQGPCWPMGTNDPMQYIARKKAGEQVQYIFRDVDTAEERVIIQYY